MRTRRTGPKVSPTVDAIRVLLAASVAASVGVGTCTGQQHLSTSTRRIEPAARAAGGASDPVATDALQFDNQGTVYVDVYLVADEVQWRLGRVPPGMRASLTVPEAAIDWTRGAVQLVVIPGSQMSAQASRDPRSVLAIAQPVSEVLSQRWTFRQPDGAPLQLQSTRLGHRSP
jgi:hypothetical protein